MNYKINKGVIYPPLTVFVDFLSNMGIRLNDPYLNMEIQTTVNIAACIHVSFPR